MRLLTLFALVVVACSKPDGGTPTKAAPATGEPATGAPAAPTPPKAAAANATAGKAATAKAATAKAATAKAQPSSMPAGHAMPSGPPTGMPSAMPPGHGMPKGMPGGTPTSMPAMPPGHGALGAAGGAAGAAGAAGAEGAALPAGHPPMPAGDVQGTVKLDPKLRPDVKAGAVLFLVARRDTGGKGKGMLLAAKKLPVTGSAMFPLAYTLSQSDVMMQGTKLDGAVTVSARIDGDGDALSKNPGDITGQSKGPVPVGAKGVDFTLDTKL